MRASDADRDAVVDRLRDAAGDGRLEPDELEQRVDGALHSRTYGDLAELVADLPGHGRMRAGWPSNSVGRSVLLGAGLLVAVTAAVALVAVVAMLALAAAACWIAAVLLWRVCCGSRRRLTHTQRARPTGFL